MKHKEYLTIEGAIDNLSNIMELGEEDSLSVLDDKNLIIEEVSVTERTIELLDDSKVNKTVNVIKETFKVVLDYLNKIHKKEDPPSKNKKTLEGIKTIMVLVGEAAQKLDKYTHLFKGVQNEKRISQLKEYRQLQNFYRTKIARLLEEKKVVKEIMKPLERAVSGSEEERIVGRCDVEDALENLNVVKQDLEYEFFFLKKEDGERFFNRKLLRNITLACDFGEDVEVTNFSEDPLIYIKNWQDKDFQISAKNILYTVSNPLNEFYAEAMKYKEMKMVSLANKTVMALMLAANPGNLLRHSALKSCYKYFIDFLHFLRAILHSRDYQKIITYPPDKSKRILYTLIYLIHSLCTSLYLHIPAKQELIAMINNLIEKDQKPVASTKKHLIAHRMENSYESIVKILKQHPNGPLFKIFDLLQEGSIPMFDTLFLDNIPCHLFDIYIGEEKSSFIRLPSPTYQEFIDKAYVAEEFKGMLRDYVSSSIERRHLLFNLQDRTSWKEHSRCLVLEELQRFPEFGKTILVVTLAMDTDFYNQTTPYDDLDDVDSFLEQFKEHISSESSGFYFPEPLKRALYPDFIDKVILMIHEVFFSCKKVLSREERKIFIDIFYLFLQLKVMDLVNPDTISLTCKDSIDVGGCANALFYSFLKIIEGRGFEKEDYNFLNAILFVPSLLIRERSISSARFYRIIKVLHVLQEVLCDSKNTLISNEIKNKIKVFFDLNLSNIQLNIAFSEEAY